MSISLDDDISEQPLRRGDKKGEVGRGNLAYYLNPLTLLKAVGRELGRGMDQFINTIEQIYPFSMYARSFKDNGGGE